MGPEFIRASNAQALEIGTPHVLSMAPLEGTLRTIHEAGIHRLRAKSLTLTGILIELTKAELCEFGLKLVTALEDHNRGGHVALAHPDAQRISQALRKAGVIVDHRPPDLIRLAPVPLYNSFQDCYEAVMRLKGIMVNRDYEQFSAKRSLIT